jgi:hypothetical protein
MVNRTVSDDTFTSCSVLTNKVNTMTALMENCKALFAQCAARDGD